MSAIRPGELDTVALVFRGGKRGYVLNFSNRTFGEFFALELDIDIDAEIYKRDGTSKGKRLRGFLMIVDDGTAAKALRLLWDYREAILKGSNQDDPRPLAKKQVFAIVAQLEGTATGIPTGVMRAPKLAIEDWFGFLTRLLGVRDLPAQGRGYAFEAYLKELFDAFGMTAREPFRLYGKQVDGSFQLAGETSWKRSGSIGRSASPNSTDFTARSNRKPRGHGSVCELRRIYGSGARRLPQRQEARLHRGARDQDRAQARNRHRYVDRDEGSACCRDRRRLHGNPGDSAFN